jgi:DMSO reductase anchor subunit
MTRIEERPDVAALRGGPGSLVPPGEVRSYYGCPVLKPPVWKKEIAGYLFTGGLAGASSVLAGAARLSGRPGLAGAARRVALGGALMSPALLIKDLGKPERFFNMLRVVRPTSPMNMGSWLLSTYGSSAGAAAVLDMAGVLPGVGRMADAAAGVTGALLTTYTGALLADTAVPAWHEARGQLPFLFAAGAATSAGAAATILTALSAPAEAGPARRLALAGLVAEQAAMQAMERRLGPLASPYHEGAAGRWKKAADLLGLAGGVTLAAAGRRRRAAAVAGGGLLLASALATRFAVFKAGFQSAEDPEATIGPQRARLAAG